MYLRLSEYAKASNLFRLQSIIKHSRQLASLLCSQNQVILVFDVVRLNTILIQLIYSQKSVIHPSISALTTSGTLNHTTATIAIYKHTTLCTLSILRTCLQKRILPSRLTNQSETDHISVSQNKTYSTILFAMNTWCCSRPFIFILSVIH